MGITFAAKPASRRKVPVVGSVLGLLVLRTGSSVDPLVTISRSEIVVRRRSAVSNMPMGMVNELQKEQILDLLAFVAWGE